jgi:signal transduction histidine kinase
MMATRETVIIDDVREDRELVQSIETAFGRPIGDYFPAAASFMAVPLAAKERAFGIISLAYSQTGYYTREMADLVQALANLAAIAIENVRLHRKVQQTATREERARVARELHDSVTQALFTMTLFAQAGRTGIESGDLDGAAHYLTRILTTGHQASKEMRLFIYELLPEQLAHLGLVDAIQQRLNAVEKRAGLKISFTAGELGDLPGPVNEVLYRITQEALNNSLKHAQADVVTVTIHRQGQRLCLEIIDDGQGFDPLEARGRGGLGLISMRERAKQLGAEFNIDSAPQGGTKISVVLEVSG